MTRLNSLLHRTALAPPAERQGVRDEYKRMQLHVPTSVHPAIDALCRKIVAVPQPLFLMVEPAPGADVDDCFGVVERHVRELGGSVIVGWQIWEWPRVLVEAEFHAVWKDLQGVLHDITPKRIPIERILFLPDPARRYESRQISNVRRPLSSDPNVAAFIAACDAEFELLNRGERAFQHGEIRLTGAEASEMVDIQERKARLICSFAAVAPKVGRNDLCPCGSGEKHKRCCSR